MTLQLFPLIAFVIITTFTPGPNNISSASMAILYGYRKTLNYLTGIMMGFFVVMLGCAYLSSTLLTVLPIAEKYLRYIGASYICWMAVAMLKSSTSLTEGDVPSKSFIKGFMLQLVNPKVAVYGLTLYSTFLLPISGKPDYLAISAVIFALTAFVATSTWALFGAMIKSKLMHAVFRKSVNVILSILLLYTALQLSGLLN